jgi:hypothetical protein
MWERERCLLREWQHWPRTRGLIKRHDTLLRVVAGIAFLHVLLALKLLFASHPRRYTVAVSLFSPQLCLFVFAFLGSRLIIGAHGQKVAFALPAWIWYVLSSVMAFFASAATEISARLTGGSSATMLWNDVRSTLSIAVIYSILWFVPALAFELSWRRMGHLLVGPPGEFVNRLVIGIASATAQAPLVILRTGVLDGVLWLGVLLVRHVVIADICGRLYQESRSFIISGVFLTVCLGLSSFTLGLGGDLTDDLRSACALWIVTVPMVVLAGRTRLMASPPTPEPTRIISR